ncbi:hypothetical protein PoB_007075700 [Plakobranchus ocellatus]|uniref:Uncharacterized protein n=1 Tax=Plakobranchus ocellatus TaxID=259542 RepID=A0AAV4DJ17_9GAST|nr:hypothetical protein PoB_007075700 [Plakobranchus ocellatus]
MELWGDHRGAGRGGRVGERSEKGAGRGGRERKKSMEIWAELGKGIESMGRDNRGDHFSHSPTMDLELRVWKMHDGTDVERVKSSGWPSREPLQLPACKLIISYCIIGTSSTPLI